MRKKRNLGALVRLSGKFRNLISPLLFAALFLPQNSSAEIELKNFDLQEGRLAVTYSSKDKGDDIYIIDFYSLTIEPIVSTPGNDRYPAWSPDGKKLAYYSNVSGNNEIFVVNADGSKTTRVTNNKADDRNPHWHPSKNLIVFQSDRPAKGTGIYTIKPDGTGVTALTKSGSRNKNPKWAPDGQSIIYSTDAYWPGWSLIRYDIASQKGKIVVSGKGSVHGAAWFPDSKQLAIVFGGAGERSIFLKVFGARFLRPLIVDDRLAVEPTVFEDGRKLIYSLESSAGEGEKVFQTMLYDKSKKDPVILAIGSGNESLRYPAWTDTNLKQKDGNPTLKSENKRKITPPEPKEAKEVKSTIPLPSDLGPAYFVDSGELKRPERYHGWVFIGAHLHALPELDEKDKAQSNKDSFFNRAVLSTYYLPRNTYRLIGQSKEIPSGTIIIRELRTLRMGKEQNKEALFNGELVGLEAAVKDRLRFKDSPGNWGYFSFGRSPKFLDKASPQTPEKFSSWHKLHTQPDGISQLYPLLGKDLR